MAKVQKETIIQEFTALPLESLLPSTTNPRETFDPQKLAELAESIRVEGIIQPIVVRPLPDQAYEIVAGERRYRAAGMAGLTEVPVRVKELSDAQVLAWQLVENSQREDVHPYHEAQGYKRLLALPGYDVATISERVGKTESHIYGRLRLLDLLPEVGEAFLANRISTSHAVLLARLPETQQREAFPNCFRKDWQDDEAHLLPAKRLAEWIEQNIYLRLLDAPFDLEDGTLCPEAGACLECSKRSGHNTKLFADVSDDYCFDSQCWQTKVQASIQRKIEENPKLVQISTTWIPAKEQDGTIHTNFVLLDDPEEPEEACSSAEDALIVRGTGIGASRRVCVDLRCPVHSQAESEEELTARIEAEKQWQAEQQQAREKQQRIRAQRLKMIETAAQAASAPFSADQLRFLFRAFLMSDLYTIVEELAELLHLPGEGAAEERLYQFVSEADDNTLPGLFVRFALVNHIREKADETDYLKEAAKAFGTVVAKPSKRSIPKKRSEKRRAKPVQQVSKGKQAKRAGR